MTVPVIATRALTKYFGRRAATCEVDLQVAAGSVYGLVGPNGAGKTTLLRLLAGMDAPTAGEIYLDGERFWHDARGNALRQRLGYLPDNVPLYDDASVEAYLDYFARLYRLRGPHRRRRVREVLELVDLTGKRRSRISTLSRGMRQRLGLARALVHEPQVLLLDEPVSGLDPSARLLFRDAIATLREAGITTVISSHVLGDLVQLCDAIGVMELGFLVESASLQAIAARRTCQRLAIATPEAPDLLLAELRRVPEVETCQRVAGGVQARFRGDATAAAALLRTLIGAGIAISDFHCTPDDLDALLLRDHRQVS